VHSVCTFLARDSIYAIARYMLSPVRPSAVRPAVCLSHGWISQRRLKLGSCNLHHRVAPCDSSFLTLNFTVAFQRDDRERAPNKRGVGKMRNFQPISSRISETVQDRTNVTINH